MHFRYKIIGVKIKIASIQKPFVAKLSRENKNDEILISAILPWSLAIYRKFPITLIKWGIKSIYSTNYESQRRLCESIVLPRCHS